MPPHTSSVNPDNRVEIHIAPGMDSTRASSVCWVIIGYHPRVQAPGPANTDLTFCTKPQEPPWIPFSKSPAPPFSFKIYSPVEEKRRWLRRGRGGTVQQLFTVVLSSYFTWKHCHSLLNSSSWPVSNCCLQHIPAQRCLMPSSLALWMQMLPETSIKFIHL